MSGDGGAFAARLRRLIRTHGPIPVAQFMAEANAHYYASRDPLGAAGDFVTAPEISQMFGEMIGAWIADLVTRNDARDFAYVELGPGRGTLAADAMRVIGAMGLDPEIHFVEASPVLRARQRERFADARFHDGVENLPQDRPLIVVANEFFDALPVRQLVRTPEGWRERMVGLDAGALVAIAGSKPMDAAIARRFADAADGTIVEVSPAATAIMRSLCETICAAGGAMLAIDYGSDDPRTGSTLQAVRAHEKVDPFVTAGEADLTAHVDFSSLVDVAKAAGCVVSGPVGQGAWLSALGIGSRAQALVRANPGSARDIAAAHDRLTGEAEMGTLFRVLAVGAPEWGGGAGFETVHAG